MSTTVSAEAAPPSPVRETPRRKLLSTNPLIRYIIVRFLLIIPTIFILVTMVFIIMRVAGDPITAALGGRLSPDQLAERIHKAGYDRPIIVQYVEYIGQVFTGNFGKSITDGRPISAIILTYGSATLELAIYALIVALIVGIPLGMLAAYFRDRCPDAVLPIFAILWYATPVFFVGLLLKLVFAVWLNILPVAGRASTGVEIDMESITNPTGIYLLDAIRLGNAHDIGDILSHAVLPGLALGFLTA